MSLLPFLHCRPTRIMDQHFGQGLHPEDLVSPSDVQMYLRSLHSADYYRPWRTAAAGSEAGSTVEFDKTKFHVSLDVQQFAPDEVTVKVTGENSITVEGKHEEKEDDHGYVSRHFVRRYVLPKGYNLDQVVSRLSTDGVLSITAPKVEQGELEHRHIPITHTGQPSRIASGATKKSPAEIGNKK